MEYAFTVDRCWGTNRVRVRDRVRVRVRVKVRVNLV